MTNRGRPKGSKNKFPKGSRKRNPMHELPWLEYKNALILSEMTGIRVEKIIEDALAEGLATLRKEVYVDLIRFNARRGKVIHERDLGKQTVDENEPTEKANAQTDSVESNVANNDMGSGHVYLGTGGDSGERAQPSDERSDDAHERSGRGSEIVQMSGGAEEESGG